MPYELTIVSHGDGLDEPIPIYQICHKTSHATDVCWHKYIENYIPQPSRHFGRGKRTKIHIYG